MLKSLTLIQAINLAIRQSGGKLKEAARILATMIEDFPELHAATAATPIVMMIEPGLSAHRDAWSGDQGTDLFEKINELCRE